MLICKAVFLQGSLYIFVMFFSSVPTNCDVVKIRESSDEPLFRYQSVHLSVKSVKPICYVKGNTGELTEFSARL